MDKIDNVTNEAIETVIDTNVKGLLYITRAILPIMRERQKGHIINVGSISGIFFVHSVENILIISSLNTYISYRNSGLCKCWCILCFKTRC